MAKKTFPLSRVYQLLEQGPVVLVTTTQVAPPLIAECYANLECRVVNMRMMIGAYFSVAGDTIKLPSGMKQSMPDHIDCRALCTVLPHPLYMVFRCAQRYSAAAILRESVRKGGNFEFFAC